MRMCVFLFAMFYGFNGSVVDICLHDSRLESFRGEYKKKKRLHSI